MMLYLGPAPEHCFLNLSHVYILQLHAHAQTHTQTYRVNNIYRHTEQTTHTDIQSQQHIQTDIRANNTYKHTDIQSQQHIQTYRANNTYRHTEPTTDLSNL